MKNFIQNCINLFNWFSPEQELLRLKEKTETLQAQKEQLSVLPKSLRNPNDLKILKDKLKVLKTYIKNKEKTIKAKVL